MENLLAVLMGVVEGLTEFLPVSSTAHLRVVPALLGWNDPGAAFTAVIQLGTLVAVLLYFVSDITAMTRGVVGGLRDGKPLETPQAKMGWMVVVGTVPVVIFGLLFKKHILYLLAFGNINTCAEIAINLAFFVE